MTQEQIEAIALRTKSIPNMKSASQEGIDRNDIPYMAFYSNERRMKMGYAEKFSINDDSITFPYLNDYGYKTLDGNMIADIAKIMKGGTK